MFRYIIFISLLGINIYGQDIAEEDRDRLADYIYSLQYKDSNQASYGAIKSSKEATVISNSESYYSVMPYLNHIGCLGLLKSNHGNKFNFVLNWMSWFINHLDKDGTIVDYYYTREGNRETNCPLGVEEGKNYCKNIDAEDSALALFWILAYEYYLASGDFSFFTEKFKKSLENTASYLINNLLKDNNLTIPKKNYPVYYTMDNSEVYKGLISLSKIEKEIYKDQSKSEFYALKALKLKTSIQTLLYDESSQLYKWELNMKSNSSKWYSNEGGIIPVLWPQLFGIDEKDSSRSNYQREVVQNNFSDWHQKKYSEFFDSFVGYIFALAGQKEMAYKQINFLLKGYASPYPYPCYIGDVGWVLMTISVLSPIVKISELEKISRKYIIYPNPATYQIRIIHPNPKNINNVYIYDLQGRLIKKEKFNTTIDISKLQSGIYFFQLEYKNFERSLGYKVIVQ